jgi:predicted transcriptional regulator of viral defense system
MSPLIKKKIAQLVRELGNVFTTTDVARVLTLSSLEASQLLSRLAVQGWLTRIRRGLYAFMPIEKLDQEPIEDPWILVPELYDPCYIGGWSSAAYWNFSEKEFPELAVFTEKTVPHKKQLIYNIPFILTHIAKQHHFGTEMILRGHKKIHIADPHKTIIDGMYNPLACGGIKHLIDCFKSYIQSVHHSPKQLMLYALQMESGAVFKRLGYLYLTIIKEKNELTDFCEERLTQGITYLDPSIKSGVIITRWQLNVPQELKLADLKT